MVTAFASVDDAFTATALPVLLYVRIGDVPVDATEASVSFGVDRAVGTCTVYCAAPRPATAEMNATIEIEMGYPGASARRFIGFIPNDESVTDDRGHLVRIEGVGWASRLTYPEYAGIEIPGPVSLKDAFRSLCALRSIPTYLADDTTATDGETTIMLGGNELVNGGHIWIDNETAPLSWLQRVPPAYGYRAFDSPDGAVRLARVSGLAHPDFTGQELTTDLSAGDYVIPRTNANFRTGPGTSYPVITIVTPDDFGRVLDDTVITANGLRWLPFTFTGLGSGYCALATGTLPLFYRQEVETIPPVYREGVNQLHFSRQRDIRDMATYIEVKGARYTGEDGGVVEIRAIPDEVPYAAELDPPGYRKATVSLQDITTDEQAQWVRNATEVDRAETMEFLSWEYAGRADLQPGDVVTLHDPTWHGITMEDYWLMSIDESVNDRGYIARYTAWRGAGEALAAGNDCRTETVTTDVIHAGTQTISWYRDPSPDSVRDPRESDRDRQDRRWVVEVPFTVTNADYSSLRLTGICHGTNSIGSKTAITGSKIEVWQRDDPSQPEGAENEEQRVGSLDLPTVDENFTKRRNYASSDQYWQAFSLPMTGTLKEGAATLVIVCGEQDDEVDDFELANLRLTYCGVGEPTLPGSIGA
jgi:hypothetical protein